MEKATFAGGCFWCMVTPFEELPGIHGILSGYTGGTKESPTYEEVKTGTTGHAEAVQITFDPEGQFHDRGPQYLTAIYYHNEKQRELALQSKLRLEQSGRFNKPIVTEITAARPFYPAEEYHQNYHKKQPKHYKEDREKSGRDAYINKHWHDL
ncbi:peptide methionine sulfoxide reductase MsrA [Paenibacillus larvae subsp. larvae]|uniref:Peptide methionine sulfoxide reductase MsrA n=1 Tax=Paenibacillus larvae subsp. larvae TaxID=147375 RepID=A0A2L1U0L1_9BACL|nr:peptide-methionine (S)-S-oxide reductase [Paenibacillus larvae]AQZ48456.1 peptide-methionine (S)-S-oxide reductase [Paenibacillus larvae subsp. pulvifaciens]AVF26466.1 peptide methionine sulfoxide reductase MsrA [Paenibacillus larvae subsp. larvae]AVF31242.1 peptide methionine sulfoxide reductase MsrA [Paenibacillus larvae subsp. larvae]MBH0341439.1 methionine sulfoxide reductase A [Paenibacillus larvae]MCY7521826.1 peptide-methionine (S)-S-oxide reductase [Paenibacillus larvae]